MDFPANQVDSAPDFADWPLVGLPHEQFDHKLDLLPPICALPHEDIIEPHVGSKGEAAPLHERLDEDPHQLTVVLPHDVLEELVVLQVVHEGYLLVHRVVENAELRPRQALQLLEPLREEAHPHLAVGYMGHPHFLWLAQVHLQVFPEIFETPIQVQHPYYLLHSFAIFQLRILPLGRSLP